MNQRDVETLRLLRTVLADGDPVPSRIESDARAARTHRLPRATSLAHLTTDTATDSRAHPDFALRAAPTANLGTRFLEFHTDPEQSRTPWDDADQLAIRLEVLRRDGVLHLYGHLSAASHTELRMVRPSGHTAVSVTPEGAFTVTVPPGPLRLLWLRPPPNPPVATPWTLL